MTTKSVSISKVMAQFSRAAFKHDFFLSVIPFNELRDHRRPSVSLVKITRSCAKLRAATLKFSVMIHGEISPVEFL